ncbi:hypothetical protein LXL04_036245 [Taraxacum kok-saghyz]
MLSSNSYRFKHDGLLSLSRNSSSKISPSNYITSASFIIDPFSADDHKPLVRKGSPISFGRLSKTRSGISTLIRSLLTVISIPAIIPTFRWLTLPAQISPTPSLGRKVTGTLFGNRRGHVSFAVQYDPRSAPVLIIELAVSTAALVKEMSSGLVRIALECEKQHSRLPGCRRNGKLFSEPIWTMYFNGRNCGYASSRACSDSDWHALSTVQSVSVGAGVLPVLEGVRKSNVGGGGGDSEGQFLYMRARFQRVVGNRDSEAFYMMNMDGNGGPELRKYVLSLSSLGSEAHIFVYNIVGSAIRITISFNYYTIISIFSHLIVNCLKIGLRLTTQDDISWLKRGLQRMISLDKLVLDGLLLKEELPEPLDTHRVTYDTVAHIKDRLIDKAAKRLISSKGDLKNQLEDFCKDPDVAILISKTVENIRHYANKKGISVMGDMPTYVSYHSADVLANKKYLLLPWWYHEPVPSERGERRMDGDNETMKVYKTGHHGDVDDDHVADKYGGYYVE